MKREETKLVLGRGEVFFDRFMAGTRVGTGELYLGNTPSFQIERTVERLERKASYRGRQIEREGAVIAEGHTVKFTTDHIDIENVALWYGGEVDAVTDVSAGPIKESFVVRNGRAYQLGKSLVPVLGLRNVDYVRVAIGATEIAESGNFQVDLPAGRIEILRDSPDIPEGSLISVTFENRNGRRQTTRSLAEESYGAVRFIAFNPYGPRKHITFPMARLSPRGAIDMKGDEWQQMQFELTAMNLSPAYEQVYIDEIESVGTTQDEQSIIDEVGTLPQFPPLDDDLDNVINVIMPSRGY